jgi:PRC-barrel domain protein
MAADAPHLCYLSADQIRGPLPTFDHLEVMDREDIKLGRLDGIIIDAAERRMEFFVVEQGFLNHRRYLLPLRLTQVDTETHALRMDVGGGDLESCARFNPGAFRRYSGYDHLAAMYHDPA